MSRSGRESVGKPYHNISSGQSLDARYGSHGFDVQRRAKALHRYRQLICRLIWALRQTEIGREQNDSRVAVSAEVVRIENLKRSVQKSH